MTARRKQYGSKPMSKAYNKVRAFIAETYRPDAPMLTDDERDELIRKAQR